MSDEKKGFFRLPGNGRDDVATIAVDAAQLA
jgi:hypothetical protein